MNLPGLPLLTPLKADAARQPPTGRSTDLVEGASGGFAAQLARSAQGLVRPPASTPSPAVQAHARAPAAASAPAAARPARPEQATSHADASGAQKEEAVSREATRAPESPRDGERPAPRDSRRRPAGEASDPPSAEAQTLASATPVSDAGDEASPEKGTTSGPDAASLAAWVAAWVPTTDAAAQTDGADPKRVAGADPDEVAASLDAAATDSLWGAGLQDPVDAGDEPTEHDPLEPDAALTGAHASTNPPWPLPPVAPPTAPPAWLPAAASATVTPTPGLASAQVEDRGAARSLRPLAGTDGERAGTTATTSGPTMAEGATDAQASPPIDDAVAGREAAAERGQDRARHEATALPGAALASAMAPERLASAERAPASFAQTLDVAALAQAQGLGAAGPGAAAQRSDGPTFTLPTPVTSPEFREALGVQVSVLARDGIQQAELHLNPVDMGPISVRIELDGQQAQVNFGVDNAQTRAIVEAGLPELASALREAGLTLTGGGVSEQARGQAGGADPGREGPPRDPGSGQRRGGGTEAETTAGNGTPPPRRLRVAGGVDLYA